MPAGHDGIGKKAKKAWRMRVREHAGSRVGTGSGRVKKAPEPKPQKKPKQSKEDRRRGR